MHATDERSLLRQLEGDLDWICLKALEKDPAQRYQSASEFEQDLQRHLAHEPVLAGRPGALYRARKFVRRNRAGVSAGVLIGIAVAVGTGGLVSNRIDALASDRLRVLLQFERERNELAAFEEQADGPQLWPAHPDKIDGLEAWLREARGKLSHLENYREALKRMQARELPWSAEEQRDHDDLAYLIAALEGLASGLLADDAITKAHGWSVPKRLALARKFAADLSEGGEHHRAWSEALPRIRADYPELPDLHISRAACVVRKGEKEYPLVGDDLGAGWYDVWPPAQRSKISANSWAEPF